MLINWENKGVDGGYKLDVRYVVDVKVVHKIALFLTVRVEYWCWEKTIRNKGVWS